MSDQLPVVTDYQASLLTSIMTFSPSAQGSGLQVYQQNLQMTAVRSLSIAFPVLAAMLGEEAVYVLARRLVASEKPCSGDWADWGRTLPALLRNSELHEEHPYLADIAAFEWAFHRAARSQCVALQADTLNRLTQCEPDTIRIRLQPSLTLVSSAFPLFGLWQLHRSQPPGRAPGLAELEAVMQTEESGCYVISQRTATTQVMVINAEEYQWLEGVKQGMTLGTLLDVYPTIDFAQWLTAALTNEWVTDLS